MRVSSAGGCKRRGGDKGTRTWSGAAMVSVERRVVKCRMTSSQVKWTLNDVVRTTGCTGVTQVYRHGSP